MATQFMARIDECQVANDWNDTTTYANFNFGLRGEADELLACTVRLHELTAAQRTWKRIRPLFKKEFAACSDNKLIIDGLANLAHRPGENPRKFMSRLEKLFNTLHENYASYRIKPERPAPLQPQGTYTQDNLTAFANLQQIPPRSSLPGCCSRKHTEAALSQGSTQNDSRRCVPNLLHRPQG